MERTQVMPEVLEPAPSVQPAKKTEIPAGSIPARSMADVVAEGGGKKVDEPVPRPDFSKLAAAQAKDKGIVAPAVVEDVPVRTAPAPKEPPKVPSLPTADEFRPKAPAAAAQWDAMKARHAEELVTAKAERDAIKAELAAAKTVGSPEVEALRKEAQQYREILRDVAIERHPEFKAKFEPREKTAVEAAKLAAGDKGAKLEILLKSPASPWRDEQIEAITAELSSSSKIRVESVLRLLDQIDLEKQSEIATQRASFDVKQSALLTTQKDRSEERQAKATAAFDTVLKQWTDPKDGHPFFIEREGDKAHNESVAEATSLAKAIFSGEMSPEEIAAASFWAASGERVLKGWQAATARAEKAERALNKMRGVQPGDGNPGHLNGGEAEKAPAPGSPAYLAYMNARMNEARAKDMGRG
jgi:hypothetical protein